MRCAVVGAGVAGLAAAVDLVRAGHHVTLFEARPHAGGRAFSFADRISGVDIDNGQHLIMGCCRATLRLLATVGSVHLLQRVEPMRIPFVHADGRRGELRPGGLPHPFSLVQGLLRHRLLTVGERVRVLGAAAALRTLRGARLGALDSISAEEWLASLGQRGGMIETFWRPIVLATMNADIHETSAKLFTTVLRELFLGPADGSDLLLPTCGLSHIIADPAIAWLRAHGAHVHLHTAAARLVVDGARLTRVEDAQGGMHAVDAVISAVPPDACAALLQRSDLGHLVDGEWMRLRCSPIVSIHVWSRTRITDEPMTGLLGTDVQWIFGKDPCRGLHHLSCTISAATTAELTSNESVERIVRRELIRFHPSLSDANIIRVKVIREKRATFIPAPGLERARPSTRTALPGLLLAGDWTATGLPATLESAARSGVRAAAEVDAPTSA